MMYVDNLMLVYVGSVELHQVHMLEQKWNMYTNKLGVVKLLDKYEVECFDEDVVVYFYEGVLACFDNNNKDGFDVCFLQAHPLEYLLGKHLGGRCLVHHGYMWEIG